ncbi:diphosphate--fructose-6-phosphate 1-phosphotransferase [Halobacillus salinarum]|uniref:Diphosphate--fructose-6-phosphate 1-phosphotransferase n=1 Tax=Halobacillus salinarum TaxID=2932257 RepID=A0ABY4EN63_9BACI|nr:diphosphate--fructose-6-phosphate 1-phosphotransferase [Halobacillus salinarum]UOQ45511.1 diphosphate--fructose-6-phosphate 1-phosphotransferase [Halobacillus salinarum]
MRKVAVGQAGGPSAVINATLAGFIEQTRKNHKLVLVENGYQGLVEERFLPGTSDSLTWVVNHRHVPGACLKSGRYPLEKAAIAKAVANLKKHQIDTLVFIGGNGTMEALYHIQQEAERNGYPLQVIGLPKTVDNDIGATDHAPGFASAANYVARTTKDMSRDLYAMNNFEQIRVLETMGRNAGWLALAAGAYRTFNEEGPHFIAVPEEQLNKEALLQTVRKAIKSYGYALVVVSEGVQWQEGRQMELNRVDGRTVLGGISKEIRDFLSQECKGTARAELLGMNQRSSSAYVSKVDALEAYQAGVEGGRWVEEGRNGCMVSIRRKQADYYTIELRPVNLYEVIAEGERRLPPSFIKERESYFKWLRPLLGGDDPSYPPLKQRRVEYSEY